MAENNKKPIAKTVKKEEKNTVDVELFRTNALLVCGKLQTRTAKNNAIRVNENCDKYIKNKGGAK